MKVDRKLFIIFFLICLAIASIVATVNYFVIMGRAIVKGDKFSINKNFVVEKYNALDNDNLLLNNISLGKVILSESSDDVVLATFDFNSSKNLSAVVIGLKVNKSLNNFNLEVNISSRTYNLGTNLTLAVTSTNKNSSYVTTIERYVKNVYNKDILLRYGSKTFKIFYPSWIRTCSNEEKICTIELHNISTSLGYCPDNSTGCWFDIIILTDGPGSGEKYWDVLIKVWS